jgi:hypothetical protein
MAETPSPPPSPFLPTPAHAWAKATMWIAIVLIFVLALLYVFRSCRDLPVDTIDRTARLIDKTSRAVATVAAAFNRGTVTTSFVSYATTISNQQYLQFATLKQMEIFSRSEVPSTAFGYIALPEVVVEARAPVEYTYYLDLNGPWRFELSNHVIHAFAPPVRFNKPAVDASAITYEVKRGYVKTADALENLKQSITSLVTLRAKENIPLVRETGRKQTIEFVERWVVSSFTDGTNYHVKVFFPGEGPSPPVEIVPTPAK